MQRIFGWILATINGLFASVGCASSGLKEAVDVTMVIFFSIIAILGVCLIVAGNKKIKLIKTFYDYSSRLAADSSKSIESLASATGVTVAVATKNISEMIASNFFPDCYLDAQQNKLIFPGTEAHKILTNSKEKSATQNSDFIILQCKGCGATNKLAVGTVGECEYCGSKITEKEGK